MDLKSVDRKNKQAADRQDFTADRVDLKSVDRRNPESVDLRDLESFDVYQWLGLSGAAR